MDEPALGVTLREAREAAGLTVDEVTARTCIRGTLVRDLEADRLASSGGLVYARGHVKSICAAVGVDAAPYLEHFARQHGGEPPVALAAPEPLRASGDPIRVPKAARPERRGPNWTAAGAAAVVVLVALFVVGQAAGPKSRGADTAVAEAPTTPSAPAKPRPASKLTAAKPAPTGAELRVRLLGGDSWVSVRNAAGVTVFEGVLRKGTVRDFRDRTSLRLVLGNAGAVNLVCSGKDLGPAGGPGAVRRFSCTRRGIAPA